MRAILSALIVSVFVLATACSKKKDAPTPANNNNNNTGTAVNPYYFRFTLNGVTDTISAGASSFYDPGANQVLSIVSANETTFLPAVTLRFSLPAFYDTITESQVLGLAGKTVYFSDTIMQPSLEYQVSDTADWYAPLYSDTSHSYYVKINTVVFLDSSNYQGYPVRNYVINGNCNAIVENGGEAPVPFTGSFNMILTRVTH